MTAPEPVLPVETEALFVAAVEAHAKKVKNPARAMFAGNYANGDKRTFRAPDGSALGMVYREDPDPEWVVRDSSALLDALDVDDSDAFEPVAEILLPSGDVALMHPDDELYRIVAEHAPHLARSATRRLRPEIVKDLLAESKRTGQAAAPGIGLTEPEGRLVVRAAEGAGAAFARMMRADLIGWDGRPALPAADEREGAA